MILEPGFTRADFDELAKKGVRLAKAGFGAVKTTYDVPLVGDAKAAGLITTCHTGGSSIPGSTAITTGDHLLKMHPHISFHINGGPTAMPIRISSA